MIDENSRYYGLKVKTYQSQTGEKVSYLGLRFVPPTDAQMIAGYETVESRSRLDTMAMKAYGDPTQFWRIADAHLSYEPETLTREVGRRLAIPMVRPS